MEAEAVAVAVEEDIEIRHLHQNSSFLVRQGHFCPAEEGQERGRLGRRRRKSRLLGEPDCKSLSRVSLSPVAKIKDNLFYSCE